jgi:hypothetical protein
MYNLKFIYNESNNPIINNKSIPLPIPNTPAIGSLVLGLNAKNKITIHATIHKPKVAGVVFLWRSL